MLLAAAVPTVRAASQPGVPRLQHVVVVVLENRERDQVLSGSSAPTLQRFARQYADLQDYTAITHPSLPNYLALVSGSTQGITSDCTECVARGPSIGTLLARAHRSWAGYAQGYPSSPAFAKKHMPFLYFRGQASHVHPLSALDPAHLPAYAFVAPDLCHDAHDCSLSVADRFVAQVVAPLLRVPKTAVFVVFDEGTNNFGGGGRVASLVLGTAVRPHSVSAQRANHYSLLRTAEDALGVGHLGASAAARPITGIWR